MSYSGNGRTASVAFPDLNFSVRVPVASSEAQQIQGLRNRIVEPDQGMLFVLPVSQWLHPLFTMTDVLSPLDFFFIDQEGRIASIRHSVRPGVRSVAGPPSRFVLEMGGGFARRHHVRPKHLVVVR